MKMQIFPYGGLPVSLKQDSTQKKLSTKAFAVLLELQGCLRSFSLLEMGGLEIKATFLSVFASHRLFSACAGLWSACSAIVKCSKLIHSTALPGWPHHG